MRWLDDPPEDWDEAPENPPSTLEGEDHDPSQPIGFAVHDPDVSSDGAYIYAWEGTVSLKDNA